MHALRTLRVRDEERKYLIRPASTLDSFSKMANILYDANPRVFAMWFNNDRERAIRVLIYLCSQPKSLFSYDHCVVVEELSTHKIICLANVADCHTRLSYDYSFLQQQDPHANQIINSYIYDQIGTIQSRKDLVLSIIDIASENGARANRVDANLLLDTIVKWSRTQDYKIITTECAKADTSLRNFYRRHGFLSTKTEYRSYLEDQDPINMYTYTYKHT